MTYRQQRMEHHLHDSPSSSRTEDLGGLLGLGASALSALGVWAGPEPGTTRWVRAAPTLLVIAMFATTAVMKLCLEQVDDLEELGERIFVCTTVVVTGIRILYFMAYRLRVQRLANLLLEARRGFPEQGAFVRSRFQRHATRVCVGFQVTAALPLALWLLDPVLTAALTSPLGPNASAVADARETPLSLWSPVDAQASPNYEAIYAFQAFLIVFTAQASLFLDMFFIVLILHITAELNVLNDSLAAIQVRSGIGERNEPATVHSALHEHDEHVFTYVHICYEPVTVTAFKMDDRRTTRSIVIGQFGQSAGVEPTPGATVEPPGSPNIAALIMAVETSGSEIHPLKFLLKETGNTVTELLMVGLQSERLVVSASSCGWPEAVPGFRRALVVFMLQASRPLCIRVGNLVTLSRNTFLQLLKDTYTMFNMLYRLQGNK
ncbi:odorant receptor 2a-like [Schistocerca gregaria]|uniref:odorant receptor 2a-like n=1 Tax=Schistocerca gregaria TaxID=7010 RepID=UPI00211EC635|nr:odorant receptor 2a-like [Schistocerca gregaria]